MISLTFDICSCPNGSSRRLHTAIESHRESVITGRHVETVHIGWAGEIHHNSDGIRFVRADDTFCCHAWLLSTETVHDIAEFSTVIEEVGEFAGDSQPSRVFNVGVHLYKVSATAIWGGRKEGEREKREKEEEREKSVCSCLCVYKLYLLKDHE